MLSSILHEVSGCRLLRNEQFGFRTKQSDALQLTRPAERVSRNFEEERLSGEVFKDVAKAFDIVWVDGFHYKLTILNFPSYLVETRLSYLYSRTFEASFQTATSTVGRMRPA
jgi:hypothetical protein